MLTDFIINHFLQPVLEDGQTLSLPLVIIATNYLYGRFLFDLFALVPFGFLEIVNKRLKILWLLKTVRIRDIIVYTKKSQYLAEINTIISWK